jgi:hypothetical protein
MKLDEIELKDAIAFEKDKVYIINISDEWLDKIAGERMYKRRVIAKKAGELINSFLHRQGITSLVMYGEVAVSVGVSDEK